MPELTHFDARGDAHMVDVAEKPLTHRVARATGYIKMAPATFALIMSGKHKKGDVLGIARVAAIMATKRTAELIPLCHPLPLSRVAVDFENIPQESSVRCTAQAETVARTGVEIEALNAVQIGLLTIYDMCKAVDRAMTIHEVKLLKKSGGRSGQWQRADSPSPDNS